MARSLFGTSRCGRLPYALIVLAVLAADFIKPPLEAFIGRVYNSQMQALISEQQQPVDPAEHMQGQALRPEMEARRLLEKHFGDSSDLRLLDKASSANSGIAASGMSDHAAVRQRLSRQSDMPLMITDDFLRKSEAFSARMTAINSFHVIAIGMVGLASLVAIAWAVLARTRDIGWPAWTALGILGVFLIKMWTMQAVPHVFTAFLHYGFFVLLLVLAFIPADFNGRWALLLEQPEDADPVVNASPSGKRSQFGQRVR